MRHPLLVAFGMGIVGGFQLGHAQTLAVAFVTRELHTTPSAFPTDIGEAAALLLIEASIAQHDTD
jgi:hypothetical protein